MCNKVECIWNSNGHKCNNSNIIEKFKEENLQCNKGLLIKDNKIVFNYKVI